MPQFDQQKQQEHIARLRAELDRLNKRLAERKQALGLNPDEPVTITGSIPPEAAEIMAKRCEQAREAGRAAVAALEPERKAHGTRRARRGSIAI